MISTFTIGDLLIFVLTYYSFCHSYGGSLPIFPQYAYFMKRDKIIEILKRAVSEGKDLFFSYKIVLMELWCRIFILGEDYKGMTG